MHNRVRMIVASFLVKDLHLDWDARPVLHAAPGRRRPGVEPPRLAVVAGTGTDAKPYFRIFNPVSQGERYDPDGDYVHRWIPELRGIDGRAVHRLSERPMARPLAIRPRSSTMPRNGPRPCGATRP